jgi:ACR3 family arsenite efflux pump ArsB
LSHEQIPVKKKETLGIFEKYLTLWIALCIVARADLSKLRGVGKAKQQEA